MIVHNRRKVEDMQCQVDSGEQWREGSGKGTVKDRERHRGHWRAGSGKMTWGAGGMGGQRVASGQCHGAITTIFMFYLFVLLNPLLALLHPLIILNSLSWRFMPGEALDRHN